MNSFDWNTLGIVFALLGGMLAALMAGIGSAVGVAVGSAVGVAVGSTVGVAVGSGVGVSSGAAMVKVIFSPSPSRARDKSLTDVPEDEGYFTEPVTAVTL